jgi:Glycosyltransferase family 87
MSSETVQRAVPFTGHFSAIGKEAAPYRWYVYAACTVLAVALNYIFGKEMASDLLHYHFYAGFSALNDRFEQDYFAAGPNSYLNPYAYAPFYLLVKLGLPGLAVGTVLAIIHSVVLWLTYEIACRVSPSEDRKERFFFGLCVTVLAFMNPVLLQQIGSSFSDITTTGLVLGGWLLLVQAVLRPRLKLVIFAAVLLGFATALKPTNGLYAVGAFFLVAFLPLPFVGRVRNLFYFGATLGTTFVLTVAPWSFRLARMFGDPMSPLLNNVFKSTAIPTTAAKHYRFIPDSVLEALLRPFAMTGTDNMVAAELAGPDVRYALLLVVFLISGTAWIWRLSRHTAIPPATSASRSATRALTALGVGFTFDWIVWLANSGNSRYFLPMASVATVLAVALLFRLLANHSLGRNGILLALFVAQGTAVALDTEYRWNQAPWDGRWFDVEIPDKLASQPNLYLSIGMQSNSYIAAFLPKGSGVVNFAGGYPLGPDGANAARVRALIARSRPRVRVLVAGDRIYEDSALRQPRQSDVDDALRTFALRLDMSDCETITVGGMRPIVWRPLESSIPAPPIPPLGKLRFTSYLASCHLVADTDDESREMAARRAVDVVLDRLEDACPVLFQPRRPQTEHINRVWQRFYAATDLTAWVGQGEVKFASAVRDTQDVFVGREDAWAKRPLPLECGRRNGIYFARLRTAGP